jgi:signal transduction histidine kinase
MAFLRRLSFRTKLIISFAAVIVLATVLGYFLIDSAVDRAFSDFSVRTFRYRDVVLGQFLMDFYERTGSWEGLARLFELAPEPPQIILADADGVIVVAPDTRFVGRRLPARDLNQGLEVRFNDKTIGTIVPPSIVLWKNPVEERFLDTVRRSLWTAGLIVTGIGILLAFGLLRQLTEPLNQLAVASQQIARGELSKRVNVKRKDELGRLADSFNEMASSLERSEMAKRQMIADVSHELRTPLTVLRTALEGLRDGFVEPTPENFAALHDKTLLTSRLVDDLHQLTLADAGQLSIKRTACHLAELFSNIQATIGVQLEDSGIRFLVEVAKDLPKVEADSQRIEQVILNLLSNAVRHTPEGGMIRMTARAIEGSLIQVSLCNTGPRLSDEDLAYVFDRFYRAEPSRSREEGGVGLGLAIAKALTEAHGGRIWAENAPDGVCFHFTLVQVAGMGVHA